MRNGRRFTSPYFNLLVTANRQSQTRLGITVSRKIGNAVIRSRVKRVIREFFRLRRPYLQPDIECVIIAKPLAGQTINAVLTKALYGLFTRFNAS
ncbi:MAG: ribonuclease P protein component [Magnetococcus sp. YQC-5]